MTLTSGREGQPPFGGTALSGFSYMSSGSQGVTEQGRRDFGNDSELRVFLNTMRHVDSLSCILIGSLRTTSVFLFFESLSRMNVFRQAFREMCLCSQLRTKTSG